ASRSSCRRRRSWKASAGTSDAHPGWRRDVTKRGRPVFRNGPTGTDGTTGDVGSGGGPAGMDPGPDQRAEGGDGQQDSDDGPPEAEVRVPGVPARARSSVRSEGNDQIHDADTHPENAFHERCWFESCAGAAPGSRHNLGRGRSATKKGRGRAPSAGLPRSLIKGVQAIPDVAPCAFQERRGRERGA